MQKIKYDTIKTSFWGLPISWYAISIKTFQISGKSFKEMI